MAQARYCPQCPLLTPATPGVPHVWCGVTLQRIGQGRTPSGLRGWLYFCPICGWTGLRRGDRWLSRGLRGAGRPRTPKSAQIAPGGTFNGGKNRGEGQESRPPYGGSPLRGSGSKEPAAPDGAAGIGIGQGDSVPLTPPGRMLKCNCRRRTNVVDAGHEPLRARRHLPLADHATLAVLRHEHRLLAVNVQSHAHSHPCPLHAWGTADSVTPRLPVYLNTSLRGDSTCSSIQG